MKTQGTKVNYRFPPSHRDDVRHPGRAAKKLNLEIGWRTHYTA